MTHRPDWCPLANHPCAAGCETPCTASKPASAAQKARFIGNYYAEPWARDAAQTMLDDFERFGYEIPTGATPHG